MSVIAIPPQPAAPSAGWGFRVSCNRDESRSRPAGQGPAWHALGVKPGSKAKRAQWPKDPAGGGTWIAASDRGLVLCLLNLNPEHPLALPPPGALTSRGLVIPSLIGCESVNEAIEGVRRLDLDSFAPFRFVAIESGADGPVVSDAAWDRRELKVTARVALPACFVSSGLGDHRVLGRLDLFREMLGQPGMLDAAGQAKLVRQQDLFHKHVWPNAPELSVQMSRRDARTVSRTIVEVRPSKVGPRVTMQYAPIPVPAAEAQRLAAERAAARTVALPLLGLPAPA
ncbi:MAG: NRDE family protein [Planctomycetota bacterium]|nr:NRDE family protein [Planctomycetota bacterium]